ncbi:hypothetical protein EMIT0111MI5_20020 [Burkholderia sp. IT-111MI5]
MTTDDAGAFWRPFSLWRRVRDAAHACRTRPARIPYLARNRPPTRGRRR